MLMPAIASLLVGVGPEGDVDLLSGDQVGALDAVTSGPDPLDRGLHAIVDDDGVAHPEVQPGVGRQPRVGAEADAQHDEIGGDRASRGVHHAGLEALDRGLGPQVEAVRRHRVADERTHLGIEQGQRLRGHLDHGGRPSPMQEGLGHLDADVAGADDDDVLDRLVLDRLEQAGTRVETVDAVDEGKVDAGERRPDRLCRPCRSAAGRTRG